MFQHLLSHRLVVLLSILAIGVASSACSGDTGTGDENGGTPTADGAGGGEPGGSGDAGTGPSGDAGTKDVGSAEPPDSACTPSCDGMACGDDGCGGSCGECEEGKLCDLAGTCQELTTCSPTCDDKDCGDDGCGGSCGECDTGYACSDTGECEAVACAATCDGKECGSDGCEGTCGTCADDEFCTDEGLCEEGTCVPDCIGFDCGGDGCGGSCGECADDQMCNANGQCTTTGDPCDPNPCVLPPADGCDGDDVVSYSGEGTCTALDGTHSCAFDETVTPCDADMTCDDGECVADTGPTGTFTEDVSMLNELIIAEANEPNTCCFDFDGDGQNDNGLVDLLSTLSSFMGDVDIDGSAADAIASGEVVVILEAIGLDDLIDDDQLGVNGYVGYFDADGALLLQPSSLDESGEPVISFSDGEIVGGVASIGPDDFDVSLPLGGVTLALAMKEARGQAEVSANADGAHLDMHDGRLGGLISFADIIGTLNTVAAGCDCLDLNGGNMFDLVDEDEIECSSAFDNANVNCNDDDGALCAGLAGIADQKFLVCWMGVGLISPDIDTDFNNKNDHFSVGVRFTGEASAIDGIGDDQAPTGCSDCAGGGGPLNGLAHLALFAMAFAMVTRRRSV